MTAPASNGGSPIISYELQILFSQAEGWVSVTGNDTKHNLDLVYTV